MLTSTSIRWLVVAVSAAMLLAVVAACSSETIEVPGETVVVKEEVIKTVEVPGETVTVEVIKEVQVPGETVVVREEVVKEVMVPGETVVVKEEVVKTVEVPGETVTVEVVKTVEVPGETVVVEKEVVKTVEVPGQTVVVEKVVVQEVPLGYVTDPTNGEVVSAPRYGGTMTIRSRMLENHVDPWFVHHIFQIEGVLEKLGMSDWGADRDEFNFLSPEPPMFALNGSLAESWESPDPLTIIFKIREGANWHDKAPMNGREVTAYDVEYSWHRMRGIPDKYGFTEPAPNNPLADMAVESITATDNNTLEWKLSEPYFDAERQILLNFATWIMPREVIEEHGDLRDWKNLVGTGPWMLTDMVFDSVYNLDKNPNYWGFDEKYPQNRLPYLDEVRALIMSEEAEMAALRTGKVDGVTFGTNELTIDEAKNLSKTNPEIEMWPYARNSFTSFFINTTMLPFDDVRVRHAMQMALDLEEVNDSYYGGLGVVGPFGALGEGTGGFYTPFEEWPEELQGYYTYNPAGAEALLDEAGYPRGADGIRFKTFLNEPGADSDMDMNIIATTYWAEIGVEVEIKPPADNATWVAMRRNTDFEGLISGGGGRNGVNPMLLLFHMMHSEGAFNTPGLIDAEFDALYDAAAAATTEEERERLGRQADMRRTWLHPSIWFLKVPQYALVQPWLVGYNGERDLGPMQRNGVVWARLWIDSELKEAMGK